MTIAATALPDNELGILPLVGEDRGNRPMWIGLGIIGILGLLLFATLEARRERASAPDVRPRIADSAAAGMNVPQLEIPPDVVIPPTMPFQIPLSDTVEKKPPVLLQATPPSRPQPDFPSPAPARVPSSPLPQPASAPLQAVGPDLGRGSPAIIYEAGGAAPVAGAAPGQPGAGTGNIMQPIRATRPANRMAMVAQGTLIAAALETAIDSTHPGQVRALVSSNVYDTQGLRILIPRGSRLYGEYKGDVSSGQNRAYVLWTKLIRPDGVTIALDSPAADRLGRTGIKGSVNTHFFERLGNALLQTTLDIGAIAASRGISDSSVVLAVPGSVQSATSQIIPEAPKPTLTVKQGARISVYVARDLDFSGVEQVQ